MASPSRMLTAAGAIATLVVSVPRTIHAQARGQQPGADAVRILIATFRSPANQGALGVDAAEAIRTRVQQDNPIRQVWVLPRQDINNYLTSSGYKADSALSASDLKELNSRLTHRIPIGRTMEGGELQLEPVSVHTLARNSDG